MSKKIIKLKKVYILWPGGNPTALVEDKISRNIQPKIADRVMKLKPKVEQVGFIEQPKKDDSFIRLQMMGGEFCGNGTRSLGWLLLNGKPGKIKLEVSGSNKLIKVWINKQKELWVEIPIKSNLYSVRKTKKQFWVISLYGIIHVIVDNSVRNKRIRKIFALEILDELNLLNKKAAGVLFIKKVDSKFYMDPFVWVKKTQTFCDETACASGTIAIGLWQAKTRNKSVKNLEVIQPSGSSFFVNVERNKSSFLNAKMHGLIKLIYKGSLNI